MKRSAGILAYRHHNGQTEILLAHPGGPFYKHKDEGVWMPVKGEVKAGEADWHAALREWKEETGYQLLGNITAKDLGEVKSPHKTYCFWAVETEIDPQDLKSNHFEVEWPPHSGKRQSYPENDRYEWFSLDEARKKILPSLAVFLDRLEALLKKRNLQD